MYCDGLLYHDVFRCVLMCSVACLVLGMCDFSHSMFLMGGIEFGGTACVNIRCANF